MKIKILIAFICTSLAWGCTDDLASLNVPTNQPSNSRTDLMMAGALRTAVGNNLQHRDPIFYVQHLAETQYTSTSTYSNEQFNYGGLYTTPLNNLKTIIDLNTNDPTNPDVLAGGSNAIQIAAAKTVWSWLFWKMTDRWGPLPYSEALQGKDNPRPAFDDPKSIYTDLFGKLKDANTAFNGGGSLNGDIMLGGDLDSWKIWANTTRLLMALRMADVDDALAKSEFLSAMNDGVISSNSENIKYKYLNNPGNYNFWYNNRYILARRDYAVSDVLVDELKDLNDPRLGAYADLALNSQTYVGMPFGLSEANAGAISNNDISFMNQGDIQNVPDLEVPLATYSTVLFAMAEAVERGWMAGNAETYYNDAIKASMEDWGVYDATDFATYIADANVAYDSANWKKSIGEQKWIALFLDGYEAWAEWRRLDYPVLTPAVAAANASGEIPVRQAYPSDASLLNKENYDAGVVLLGGPDGLDTKLWWDKY